MCVGSTVGSPLGATYWESFLSMLSIMFNAYIMLSGKAKKPKLAAAPTAAQKRTAATRAKRGPQSQ